MDELEKEPGGRAAVKSALRVLEILELFMAAPRPLSFSECQQRLGYPKASLHSLLRTMLDARWLSYDEAGKGYVLGVRVWEAGVAYTGMSSLEGRAKPFMLRLRDQTTETVQLAILDDFEVLYIGKVDGDHMLRLESAVGRRLEAHASGVGKVLWAGLPEERLRAWMNGRVFQRFTATTIVDHDKLLSELQSVRALGHAIDREERTLGASCVAVAIYDHNDAVVAAMSVSAPAVRFGKAQRVAALVHLRQAAVDLSAILGHTRATEMSSAVDGALTRDPGPEGSRWTRLATPVDLARRS